MVVRSHLLLLSFPQMDSLEVSTPARSIRTNCCESGEFLSSPNKVTSGQLEINTISGKQREVDSNSSVTMTKAHGDTSEG